MKAKIEFELNVPSGSMVFSDSLPGFRIFGDFDVNTKDGLIRQTMAMARIGCAHGFVGNSYPGVYRIDDKTLVVANVPFNEDTGEPQNYPGEFLGTIITDLWWYSFADGDEYNRRCDAKKGDVTKIKVLPGVYKFSHLLPLKREYGKPYVHATITWIREADPLEDYLKEFREKNFTAGQVIAHELKRWPDLYSGENAVMQVANHIFCVIGGGGDWHPNGFVQYDPDMPKETNEIPIPVFDKVFPWYPLCEYSALIKAANGEIHLNSSFATLAKNIARCMATHEPMGISLRRIAAKYLKKLNERYPDHR